MKTFKKVMAWIGGILAAIGFVALISLRAILGRKQAKEANDED